MSCCLPPRCAELYELADIDRDRYTILAVDLSIDGPLTATVYGDRAELNRGHGA